MTDHTTKNCQEWARALMVLFCALIACACGKVLPEKGLLTPPAGTSNPTYSNYIVVGSSTNQSVVLLDPDGRFVRELLVLDGTTTDAPTGIGIFDSSNILVAVDGVDRVLKVNLNSGNDSAQNLVLNANLTGTLGNVTRLVSGDILVVETSNVERFTSAGTRVTSGSWPKALQTTMNGIEKLPGGGFVACSTGTDVIRAYSDDGIQAATASSGIGGTSDVRDCATAVDGRVAAAFNGTTDTIRIYTSSTLGAVSCNFSNASLLGDPRAIAFRPNGNLLATDGTANTIIEIDSSCNFVRAMSSSALATPVAMRVIQ
jgi:hypothetical protein